MRQFNFDLSQASLSDDVNPFAAAAGSGTDGSPTTTASGSEETGSSGSESDSSGGSGSSEETGDGDSQQTINFRKAHGIIMGVTVVLLFPIGAIFMRLVGSPMLHSLLQVFALLALIVGFGLGVKLAQLGDQVSQSETL